MKKKQHHARRRRWAARGQETSKKNSPKGDSLKTGLQMHFWPVIKYIKLVLWFTYMLKKVHLQQFEGMQSSKLGKRKQYRLLKEGIWKGYLFCHK